MAKTICQSWLRRERNEFHVLERGVALRRDDKACAMAEPRQHRRGLHQHFVHRPARGLRQDGDGVDVAELALVSGHAGGGVALGEFNVGIALARGERDEVLRLYDPVNNIVDSANSDSGAWPAGTGAACYANQAGGRLFDLSGNVSSPVSLSVHLKDINEAPYHFTTAGVSVATENRWATLAQLGNGYNLDLSSVFKDPDAGDTLTVTIRLNDLAVSLASVTIRPPGSTRQHATPPGPTSANPPRSRRLRPKASARRWMSLSRAAPSPACWWSAWAC